LELRGFGRGELDGRIRWRGCKARFRPSVDAGAGADGLRAILAMLRRSAFARLTGCEDVDDASDFGAATQDKIAAAS
jgi:hypothetical protein